MSDLTNRLSAEQVQRAIELAEPDKPTFDPTNIIAALAREVQESRKTLAAIDGYIVQLRQEGGPVCDTIANHLTEFLHPKEADSE